MLNAAAGVGLLLGNELLPGFAVAGIALMIAWWRFGPRPGVNAVWLGLYVPGKEGHACLPRRTPPFADVR